MPTSTADLIVGVDEAGVGCWAGCCFVAAVAIDRGVILPECVKDSKCVSDIRMARAVVQRSAAHIFVERASVRLINDLGIWNAWQRAMKTLLGRVERLDANLEVIIDGNRPVPGRMGRCVPRADKTIPVVGAASIVAKDEQLWSMWVADQRHPEYGFDQHHGYGTSQHREALETHGICDLHRTGYKPIKAVLEARRP